MSQIARDGMRITKARYTWQLRHENRSKPHPVARFVIPPYEGFCRRLAGGYPYPEKYNYVHLNRRRWYTIFKFLSTH